MTGAIEFLRKAKAICNSTTCGKCPLDNDMCLKNVADIEDEAELVRKVMTYRINKDTDIELTEQEKADYKAEYEEAMKQDCNPCEVCEDNQLDDCAYLENDDRKSCPKVMDYQIKEVSDEC